MTERSREHPRRRGGRRALLGAALLAAALALPLLPATVIETAWARTFYPAWTRLVVPLSATAAPFGSGALGGSWSLLLLPVATVALIVVVGIAAAAGRWRAAAGTLLLSVGAAALLVTAGWALGYRRLPVAELLALPATGVGSAELLERLLVEIGSADAALPPGPLGRDTERAAYAAVAERMTTLVADRFGSPAPRLPAAPKALPAGALLRGGYSGIVSPFALEAHVDAALPAWTRIATGAHELAHLAAFAREGDAEAIGALAALTSDAPAARYAAALAQFTRVVGRLPEGARSPWLERLPPRARDDLQARRDAVARWRAPGWAARVDAVYARWLRSQGESAGLDAYDAGAELLARAAAAGLLDR